MTELAKLLNDIPDEGVALSAILLRAKILASNLKSDELAQWVKQELDGYVPGKGVPDYRKCNTALLGDFHGPFNSGLKNVPLSLPDKQTNDSAHSAWLYQSVGQLQALLDGPGDSVQLQVDPRALEIFRKWGPQVSGLVLNFIHQHLGKAAISGTLQAIRSKLLDFLLALKQSHPEIAKDDEAAAKVPQDETARLVLNCFGPVHMGDSFSAHQAAAVGPNAKAVKTGVKQGKR